MPADTLSREATPIFREKVRRMHSDIACGYFVSPSSDFLRELAEHALSEPARLASARAEGVREGIERCATRLEEKAAAFLKERDRHMRAWNETEGTPAEKVHSRRACSDEATAASLSDWAAELRALPPPPAEPTGMTADGWIEWKGGECPVAPKTTVEPRYRNGESDDAGQAYRYQWDHWPTPRNEWDIVAYRIVKPAEPSAPVAPDGDRIAALREAAGIQRYRDKERITALEAENAKLREGLKPFSDAADGFDGPGGKRGVPDAFHILRGLDVGDLRRARALLQGGPDAG